MSEKETLEPTASKPNGNIAEESKNDGFELNPKYKSVQEQARAYGEAQKAITRKSQEVAELKKQLDESTLLLKNFGLEQTKKRSGAGDSTNADAAESVEKLQPVQNNAHYEADNNVNAKIQGLKSNHQKQIENINALFKSGQITLAQAVRLKEFLDAKMNNSTKNVLNLANSQQKEILELRKNKAVEGFKAQKPDFFNANERLAVIEYLKSASDDLDAEELENVSKLVEMVENGAIERFKQAQAQGEIFNQMNEEAKVRLNSSVEGAGASVGGERVFTKDEIKKMSSKEFRKHENAIMDQMRKGKIKG